MMFFPQNEADQSTSVTADAVLPPDTCILDWIDSWGYVRDDVLRLLGAYERADGGHDTSRFLALVDETDAALRLLKHRVDWLRSHLGRSVDQPLDPA